ncbi:MAG: carbohydrate kinase [Thermoanaerobaculia bacterium]|nr:carbohydrate kinase [Thermoanaerobaculia bacterium]
MSECGQASVLCFGEILWDSLPHGLFPGGAPLNVAYHLRKFGLRPVLVTAVGRDRLGEEMLRRLEAWNIDATGVALDPDWPTGLSRVTLNGGSPGFEIARDAAWDRIQLSPEVREVASGCAAVVFGSLAQRTEHNRLQLAALLALCPTALRVFDVNLRPPFEDAQIVWNLARRADLVKLSDQELASLLGESLTPADFAAATRRFALRADVRQVCLTAGALGAGLYLDGRWIWRSSRPAPVRDSVGAGDAFLAAFLFGRLREAEPPERTLRRACRLARFIVTQDGATPAYRLDSEGNVVS